MPITEKVVSQNPVMVKCNDETCDKVYQWLTAGPQFSPGTPVSTTDKTDHYDITKVLLKVALSTTDLNLHFIIS